MGEITTKLGSGPEYDGWVTLKKFFVHWGIGFISLILPYSITTIQEYDWPPETLVYIPIVVGVLSAILNAWNHWNDGKSDGK